MRVVIDIPKDFARDYSADKFKDFFSRVIADIDCMIVMVCVVDTKQKLLKCFYKHLMIVLWTF